MIRWEPFERVGLLTVDRHAQRNALDLEHVTDLRQAVRDAVAAGSRCLVITGEGSSFCAGADLSTLHSTEFRDGLKALFSEIEAARVPVLAAVNGPAIGAGTQLAVACDLRVAVPRARFAVPTARLGVAADGWTVRRLASMFGGGPARALLLGAETIGAERAHQLGMVDRIGDLDDALSWAQEIAELAPLALAFSKHALNATTELDGDDGPAARLAAECWGSEDVREAHRARTEGRRPVFEGR